MNMFRIRFLCVLSGFAGLVVERPRPAAKGEIGINDFRETFYAPLDVWTRDDYEHQWLEARQRLHSGARSSCFVVSVHPPNIARFVETWSVWRREQAYRIQNRILCPDEVGAFDPHRPYDVIGPYRDTTEDGDRIYDWELPPDTQWLVDVAAP